MTNSVNEILDAELLFVIGSNTTEAHPIIGNKMKQAVRNGTKLIVVDPRTTELAAMADLHLRLRSGSDAALINGMMHNILREGWEDRAYIEARTDGFEAVQELVKNYTPEVVSAITDIPEDDLYEAAKLYAKHRKAGIFYTLGITEHTSGTSNVMNLANLALITGHVGIESAGINPLRGQNNVQGACDMGALPDVYPGYQKVTDPASIARFSEVWGVSVSEKLGLRIPEMLDGAVAGDIRAMYVMGEDPVLTDPDANHVKKAFEAMEFVVVQELFMSETAKFADVILPAACYAEKDGTFTASERRVQRVRKAVEPPGQAKQDWEIIVAIAEKMGAEGFDFLNSEEIFEEIRRVTPQYAGMTYERLEKERGLQWPCPTLDHPGTKYLHKGTFPRGKATMVPVEYKGPAEHVCDEYPFLLITGRKLGHYNVTTRYSELLDSINPFEEAEINPREAEALGLSEHDTIRVTSRRGSIVTRVQITDRVKPGSMFMTFHYRESPVNELTQSAFDPITLTGEYKVSAVKIEKVEWKDEQYEDEVQRFKRLELLTE
jgi:formate dehydrogenase alpha subunit